MAETGLPDLSARIEPRRYEYRGTAESVGAMLSLGAECLKIIQESGCQVDYLTWLKLMRSASPHVTVEISSCWHEWVWDSLRTSPDASSRYGELPPAGAAWSSKGERFEVLPKGAVLSVGLSTLEVKRLRHLRYPDPMRTGVTVVLQDMLWMRPGKKGRLECCDVAAEVWISSDDGWPLERESDVMRIDVAFIRREKDQIVCRVKSLNQALTVATKRLRPDRRSHSGRIYDCFLLWSDGKMKLLEDVRRDVEAGIWFTPKAALPRESVS